MKWSDLAAKRIPAPFVPRIQSELDTSNFAEEFTRMPIVDSPAAVVPNVEKIFKVNISDKLKWVAVISTKNHKRQRRKRQSVTAKREKSQTPKVLTAIPTLPYLT